MINKLTKYVKKTTKKASTFVNKVIHGRDDLSPSVKKLLSQYGNVPIIGITIFRHKLASPLVPVMDAVSGFVLPCKMIFKPDGKVNHMVSL